MNLKTRLDLLIKLGAYIAEKGETLQTSIRKSYIENKWFTEEQVVFALESISKYYLRADLLNDFCESYNIGDNHEAKQVALIPAGNIPLVGFHDMLCVFLTGHTCQIKPSSKDKYLAKTLVEALQQFNPEIRQYFSFVERLKDFDAVIATGSDNTSRYFEYYFKDRPHLIRKNRNGIAILTGDESEQDLRDLGNDVFRYFGLGCRNVSKLYIPRSFDVKRIFEFWKAYDHYIDHNKYANNFDYNSANFILGEAPFLTNNVFILKEDKAFVSRISTIHYEYYDDLKNLQNVLIADKDKLQCVATNLNIEDLPCVKLGEAQKPSLFDFADGVDTIQFLQKI